MKRILTITLSIIIVFCLSACNNNGTNQDKFVKGEKLICPVGEEFNMQISGEYEATANITLNAIALQTADIKNKNDYLGAKYSGDYNNYQYFQYIYQLELKGKVNASFAGKKMVVNVAFEDKTNPSFYDIKNHEVKIDSNGTFSVKTRIGSNKIEKYIYPLSLTIR